MSVRWSATAADQLVAIRDTIARSSPGYAQAVVARIVQRADSLDGQSMLGAEVPEYGDPAIRELVEHPYRIIYQTDGQDVQVIAVIHGARRLPRTPPG